jgi:YHS domain-containing protein
MATKTNLGKSGSQVHCPITGEKLKNKDVFVDYQGQRIYFCCAACIDAFLKNPEAAFGKIEKKGEVPANVQKTCPVCDGSVDPKTSKFFMYKGRKIYIACPGCDKKFIENPQKYLKKLDKESKASREGTKGKGSGHQHGGHGHH